MAMVGRGRVQAAALTWWQVTEVAGSGNDIWTETVESDPNANAAGFLTSSTQTVRWGRNEIDGVGLDISYGAGQVRAFSTVFDFGGLTEEAQAVVGDSGGAVFAQNGSGWVLAGMMAAVGTFDNQPGGANTAVFGNVTAALDLSFYRDSILQAVPEPSIPAFMAVGVSSLVIRRRRQELGT